MCELQYVYIVCCYSNKTSAEQALLLSSQIHNGYVFHAQFSHDSLYVLSCSSEKELKVGVANITARD